jgi:hypothetical protein
VTVAARWWRAAARRVLSDNARFMIRTQRQLLGSRGPAHFAHTNVRLAGAWLRDRRGRRHYRQLDENALRAARRSDTVFICGSGASLNELTPAEWAHVAAHDVFGFNHFYCQRWVPVGFHLLRGAYYGDLRWEAYATEVAEAFRTNPCFADTIVLLQGEYTAELGNTLIGRTLLPTRNRVFRYRTARADGPPTRTFAEGVRHTSGTLSDVVNCAYLVGWTRIVLLGVDLYDSRYFFLPPDKTLGMDPSTGTSAAVDANQWRGNRSDQPHNTLRTGVVPVMTEWRRALNADGVELAVYNPRSLLAGPLPVYEIRRAPARQSQVS